MEAGHVVCSEMEEEVETGREGRGRMVREVEEVVAVAVVEVRRKVLAGS